VAGEGEFLIVRLRFPVFKNLPKNERKPQQRDADDLDARFDDKIKDCFSEKKENEQTGSSPSSGLKEQFLRKNAILHRRFVLNV
jgi:hypothetical protein